VPVGEGCEWGVTLSFWPGNGNNPATSIIATTTTPITIQIVLALPLFSCMADSFLSLRTVFEQLRCRCTVLGLWWEGHPDSRKNSRPIGCERPYLLTLFAMT
jgi:hypothetical protein